MDIDRLFSDRSFLEKELGFFTEKKHIRRMAYDEDLVRSHLKKARHNLEFYTYPDKRVCHHQRRGKTIAGAFH